MSFFLSTQHDYRYSKMTPGGDKLYAGYQKTEHLYAYTVSLIPFGSAGTVEKK